MKCNLCPRVCNVDRNFRLGFCQATNTLKVARAALHFWEEPCISGSNGSGTIFFANCNLKCCFCQNKEISLGHFGKEITIERFSEICLELQEKKALNINLVTPTHYIKQIKEGLILAKSKGLKIPIVYNTSSYECVGALKELDGLVDIYLPDLKYFDDTYARLYSHAPYYFKYATLAIKEMFRQVGKPVFDENGIMQKGVIVRHLILPGLEKDSKRIIKYLFDTYKDNIYMSIMNQYTPVEKFTDSKFLNLNKKVDDSIYEEVIDYACALGITNAFIQEGETQDESFIPSFNTEGV